MKYAVVAALSLWVLAGCAAKKGTAGAEEKTLEGTYWVLTELNGKAVEAPANKAKPYYIFFNKEKSRVNLSGGCNVIGGGYELMEGGRIKFGNLMSTMMACPDMTVEEGLKRMAEMVDSYAIDGNNLSFSKARMAPAARFKAASLPRNLISQ